MTVNVPLLRKAVEWVEEQSQIHWKDREWNQSRWISNHRNPVALLDRDYQRFLGERQSSVCGTTYCVAGYVAVTDGWVPRRNHLHDDQFTKDGMSQSAGSIARDILGITNEQARSLFLATADAQDIRHTAEEISGERL